MQRHCKNRGTLWIEHYPFDPVYKVPSTVYMVGRFTYKWFKYPSKNLGYPISNRALARDNGPEGGTSFMDFWKSIELRGDAPVGYVVLYIPSSILVSLIILLSIKMSSALSFLWGPYLWSSKLVVQVGFLPFVCVFPCLRPPLPHPGQL